MERVIKIHSGKYTVENSEGEIYVCTARGNLKIKSDGVLTGDFVTTDNRVITGVLPRKNKISRPSVANVDCMAIVVADPPAPDFYLFDKLLSGAVLAGVTAVFVVNKADVSDETAKKIIENYSSAASGIFVVSAESGEGVDKLADYFRGKLTVFTGQSAVGKTSLVNRLFGHNGRVGELSAKTNRGKQTTTVAEIVSGNGAKIVDTAGFTAYDLKLSPEKLKETYPEYAKLSRECYFADCVHVGEPDCAVKNAVASGILSKQRYARYTELYKELKEKNVYGKNR